MRPRHSTALVLVLLAAIPVCAQQWTQKPTDEKITLVDAGGKRTTLDPGVATPIKVTKWFKTANWDFQVQGTKADTVVASPAYIDLEGINPKKRQLVIQVIKLKAEDGIRKWVMETSSEGFFAKDESAAFKKEFRPSASKGENGHWRIMLPSSLSPGEYAVVSDGDYWDFAVAQ